MSTNELEKIINEAFENRQSISESSDKKILNAVNETIDLTDKGKLEWQKKLMESGQLINGLKKQSY